MIYSFHLFLIFASACTACTQQCPAGASRLAQWIGGWLPSAAVCRRRRRHHPRCPPVEQRSTLCVSESSARSCVDASPTTMPHDARNSSSTQLHGARQGRQADQVRPRGQKVLLMGNRCEQGLHSRCTADGQWGVTGGSPGVTGGHWGVPDEGHRLMSLCVPMDRA